MNKPLFGCIEVEATSKTMEHPHGASIPIIVVVLAFLALLFVAGYTGWLLHARFGDDEEDEI